MKRIITEESVLFFSITKWVILAACCGALVGASTALFLHLLAMAIAFTARFPHSFLLLPLALLGSALLTRYVAPEARGHGTEKVIEAIHKTAGKIPVLVAPIKLVATIMTLALGGSAGKEGPCAQIGAALSSLFASLLRLGNGDRKKLVVCGISAGFASVFGTPIGGAVFGLEVLFVGAMQYDMLLPSFVSSMIAYHVAVALGISYLITPLSAELFQNGAMLPILVLAGLFFGLCALVLIESLKAGHFVAAKLPVPEWVKPLIGGMTLIVLAMLFSSDYLGLGLKTIEDCLRGQDVVPYAFLLKCVFTAITLSFGGSGGIVTPIFFVGATAGVLFADLFGLDRSLFAAIGLVSLLSGAANTPIATSIMAAELFGASLAPYAAIACVISFLMTGHRSVYPSQILAIPKSASIRVQTGAEIHSAAVEFVPRPKTITGLLHTLWSALSHRAK